MIQLKVLTKQKGEYFSLPSLQEIFQQLETILGYKSEKVQNYDSGFNGIYLTTDLDSKEFLNESNADKIFVLGVTNSSIPLILKKYKVIGLTQWRLTNKKSRMVYAQNSVISENSILNRKFDFGYSMAIFPEFDNQENALAQTIVKYLTMYDSSH